MEGFNIPLRYKSLQKLDTNSSSLKQEHLSSTQRLMDSWCKSNVDTAVMDVYCSNNVLQARRAVEQLRLETELQRIKISAAAEQLVQYCQEHRRADPLLTGINASSNPFKDKKTCVLL
ncbi:GGL domain-containing protein [Sinocyclocheilus rhinocerous]|uniref:GGL domain-containing protein n=1 Tax=Sinocyclocheilus rhinocerous TaxID=307959 RepID=UPI0007BA809C|nr:PREDICTED: guanine nucleotide-binding protein G(I)/G(S)/G(O) subunit gamma-12-like [Sinocyclocheilus rhinocerous]